MHKAEIEILGQKYTIKGELTEPEMRELASYVDSKIKEVLKRAPGTAPLNAAILAALNIAGEYHATRKNQDELAKDIARKASVLTSLFE